MAITAVGSTQNDVGTATEVEINTPAVSDNDLMVFWGGNGQDDGSTATASGWTTVMNVKDDAGTDGQVAMMYKFAASEPASHTFEFPGSTSNQTSGIIAAFRGVDTSTPFDVDYDVAQYVKGSNDPTPQPASITTVTDGAFVLVGSWFQLTATTAINVSSGYTELEQIIAGNRFAHLQYKEVSSAGSEAPGVVTCVSGESGLDVAQLTFALRPAGGSSIDGSSSRGVMRGVGRGL